MYFDPVARFLERLVDGLKARQAYERFSPYRVDGAIIGNGSQDFTKTYMTYTLAINGVKTQLIDCPGIEGNEGNFREIIENALKKCHLVCYVARESKGIETGTLEKIHRYLRGNVEVMGIQNVPFNPQKEYEGGSYFSDSKQEIDKSLKKRGNIEDSLKSVIPSELYSKTISISALPGLCAIAQRDGESTFADPSSFGEGEVVRDSLNTLRRQQRNFLRHATKEELVELSCLAELRDAISDSCANAPIRIKRNALLRLREKLKVLFLDPMEVEGKKIEEACQSVAKRVNAYRKNLDNARFQMSRNMENAVHDSIYNFYLTEVLEKIIYPHIERNVGIEEDELNQEISDHANQLESELKKSMVLAMQTSLDESIERIGRITKEFQHGMELDFAQLNAEFPVLSGESFGLSDFGDWALSIGGWAMSGFAIGSMFPGIGNVIGAIAGAVVGIVMKLVEWFMSDSTKINRAKSKARDAIERASESTWNKVSGSVTQCAAGLSGKIGEIMDKAERKKATAEKTQKTIFECIDKLRALLNLIDNQINSLEVQHVEC